MDATRRLKVLQEHIKNPIGCQSDLLQKRTLNSFPISALSGVDRPYGNPSQFRYTLDRASSKLSWAQRQFYEDNGYLVIPNLVSHDELDRFQNRFEDLCSGKIIQPGVTLMKDISLLKAGVTGEKVIYKAQDFIYDPVLFNYCQITEILDYVECFTGPNISAMHTMLINKPPDSGTLSSRHPLHQDLQYFPFRPADRIVCSWTAMEHINRDNGCLVVLPGTHKGPLLSHEMPNWEGGVNKFYYGIEGLTDEDFNARVHLEMNKGDTVFFHPLIIHGSGANRTKGFRKAISCHYASSNCEYVSYAEDSSSAKMHKELTDFIEKRFNIIADDPTLIWQARSRLVRGEKVNV
ncbi:hypothetical protein CHUAL_003554 [Chamberlinius hualienensis]